MKKILTTSAIAVVALFAGTSTASADPCYSPPVVTCVYKVKTVQVNCCHYQRTAYDHCGRPYCYTVAVYTYRDIYSNGTSRTWTRTVRV
ncbi:MAG: hypothetical protein P1V20_20320 [Verrucomicrobiales bacterium]|nr:hypothetical protein [Verrucomicrobiales bacterium]